MNINRKEERNLYKKPITNKKVVNWIINYKDETLDDLLPRHFTIIMGPEFWVREYGEVVMSIAKTKKNKTIISDSLCQKSSAFRKLWAHIVSRTVSIYKNKLDNIVLCGDYGYILFNETSKRVMKVYNYNLVIRPVEEFLKYLIYGNPVSNNSANRRNNRILSMQGRRF